jgi:hypothetical protein
MDPTKSGGSNGTAVERSVQVGDIVVDILTDPKGRTEVLDNMINIWDSAGRGLGYGTDGSVMGFLEPRP